MYICLNSSPKYGCEYVLKIKKYFRENEFLFKKCIFPSVRLCTYIVAVNAGLLLVEGWS